MPTVANQEPALSKNAEPLEAEAEGKFKENHDKPKVLGYHAVKFPAPEPRGKGKQNGE